MMISIRNLFCSLFCLLALHSYSQQSHLTEKFMLPNEVNETSGLIFFNDKIITHNDSGDEPNLYEIDSLTGALSRTITINNATHVDWEDIAQDDTHIYIADIGNNSGDRQDLKIYRILKSDYIASNSVSAEIISFSYEDQVSFTSQPNNTNFDAEAIGIFNDNIVIFSKNWVDLQTNAYIVPKTVGTHTAQKVSTYNSQGLITGADFQGDRIMLSGYDTTATPFLVFVHENRPPGLDFFGGTPERITLEGTAFLEQGSQIEAIGYFDFDKCYVSREFSSIDVGGTIFEFPQKLYEFTSDLFSLLSTNDEQLSSLFQIAPNPVEDSFEIIQENNEQEIRWIQIFNSLGKEIVSLNGNDTPSLSHVPTGMYFIKIQLKSGSTVVKKILKK